MGWCGAATGCWQMWHPLERSLALPSWWSLGNFGQKAAVGDPLCLVFAQKGELTGTDAETFPFELYSGVLSNFPHFFAFPDGICSGPLACPSANIRTAPCQQAASCIAQAAFRRALPIFFCGTKIKQHLGKGSQAWSVLGPATAGAIPGLSKAFHKGGAPG